MHVGNNFFDGHAVNFLSAISSAVNFSFLSMSINLPGFLARCWRNVLSSTALVIMCGLVVVVSTTTTQIQLLVLVVLVVAVVEVTPALVLVVLAV
jgi:hypothetical protein